MRSARVRPRAAASQSGERRAPRSDVTSVRHTSKAGLRTSRRREACAREHDGGVCQRSGARQRRARVRRAPFARRHPGRDSRQDARSDNRRDGSRDGRTAAELAAVDAGFRFVPRGRRVPFRGQGIGVPTLEEVMRAFPDVRMIIEMKQGEPSWPGRCWPSSATGSSVERVCVGSFYRPGSTSIRAEAPELRPAPPRTRRGGPCTDRGAAGRFVAARLLRLPGPRARRPAPRRHASLPAQAHRDGARVDVWVVDAAEDIERLFKLGVDGVITDRPDMAVAASRRLVWRSNDDLNQSKDRHAAADNPTPRNPKRI